MVITQDEIAQVVERFIRGHFQVLSGDPAFNRDAHLYEGGFVDSMGVVELIAFVESTFDVTLKDEDVFGDLFTTVNGICDVVLARRRDNGSGSAEMDGARASSASGA